MAGKKPAWPADSVERRSLASLKPFAGNARTHTAEQVAEVVRSIEEWGWTMPVLIDPSGEIIAGHARVLAAQQLGLDEVPCIVARDWTDEQRRAYVIADNKLGLNSGWDAGLLRVELGDLKQAGFDLGLTGFDAAELKTLFTPRRSLGKVHEDDAPGARRKAFSKLGDVWQLGRHRLVCGDCRREDEVRAVMGDDLADMVFTDPPYGVSLNNRSKSNNIAGDITQGVIPIAFKQAIDIATKPDARLYFCGGTANVGMYYSLFDAYLRKMPLLIVWDKGNIVLRRNNYHSQFEVVFFGWKGAGGDNKNWFGPRTMDAASDLWTIKRDAGQDYLHPTQKPVELARRAIANSCPAGGLVFEPFSGSGSTLIACEKLGAVCRAMDIDPIYADVTIDRWQRFTGEQAVRDDGAAFERIDEGSTDEARTEDATAGAEGAARQPA